MNLIINAKSNISGLKQVSLNDDPNGLFINKTKQPIQNNSSKIFDIDLFLQIHNRNQNNIKLSKPDELMALDNILQFASLDSIPLQYYAKLQKTTLPIFSELPFPKFLKQHGKNADIYLNAYNAVKDNENNETYKLLKKKFKIVNDYKIWDNATWRITHPLQTTAARSIFQSIPDHGLSIDVSSQDFTVFYSILNIPIKDDPFTDLTNEIGLRRDLVKNVAQKISYGFSFEDAMNIIIDAGEPMILYHKLVATDTMQRIFEFNDIIKTKRKFCSYYLNRPIEFDSEKSVVARYIQAASSDMFIYLLNLLRKEGLSKYLVFLQHDEFMFKCDDMSDYHTIEQFFMEHCNLNINNKRPLKLKFKSKLKVNGELIEKAISTI